MQDLDFLLASFIIHDSADFNSVVVVEALVVLLAVSRRVRVGCFDVGLGAVVREFLLVMLLPTTTKLSNPATLNPQTHHPIHPPFPHIPHHHLLAPLHHCHLHLLRLLPLPPHLHCNPHVLMDFQSCLMLVC